MQRAMPQVGCKQLMWETEMLHFHIWHAKSHATSRLQAVNVEDRDVALSHLACKEPYHKQVASSYVEDSQKDSAAHSTIALL